MDVILALVLLWLLSMAWLCICKFVWSIIKYRTGSVEEIIIDLRDNIEEVLEDE